MASRSQTWSGRDWRPQSTPSESRRSSFAKFFHLPIELKTLTHGIAHKVVQPIEILFRRKSTTAIPIVPIPPCDCAEALQGEHANRMSTNAEIFTPSTKREPVQPWPPIVRSTEEPLGRYHSFPEPKFADERRGRWLNMMVRKAKQKFDELWRTDVPTNLLRRKPVAEKDRERFKLVVMVNQTMETRSEETPRLPSLSLSSGMGDM